MEKELVTRLSAIGMTRKDLAQSLGVSLSSIYHWRELPKYVEAYLDARYREIGLAVSSVQGDMVPDSVAVQLSGGLAGTGTGATPAQSGKPGPVEGEVRRDGTATGGNRPCGGVTTESGGRRRG